MRVGVYGDCFCAYMRVCVWVGRCVWMAWFSANKTDLFKFCPSHT